MRPTRTARHLLPARWPAARRCLAGAAWLAVLAGGAWAAPTADPAKAAAPASTARLAFVAAEAGRSQALASYDGVVEAVRQTVVAAQVSGAVVELAVKAGDVVKAGQLIARIDARSADQAAAASDAQVLAARALQEVAAKEFNRQRQLFEQRFISQAALDKAESEFKATQAQAQSQMAQAGAARTQTGLHVVRAPYAGVVSELSVALGDMAMPGRPLVTIHDPQALRITAAVPQSVVARLAPGVLPRVELPGQPAERQWVTPLRAQLLPVADAATHTVPMRADLPPGLTGLAPGMFARLWLPQSAAGQGTAAGAAVAGTAAGNPRVPVSAIVRRAEMTGLYVLDANGRPLLRQVRLGRVDGLQVEVLAGLQAGEQVATDPQAAARAP